MTLAADCEPLFGRIEDEARRASKPSPHWFAEIIDSIGRRPPASDALRKAARIERLIEAEAWTDCALALIDVGLPRWRVRRLAYEGGVWFCALSPQPNLPAELDDTVDASHEILTLAIFCAFVEACRRGCAGLLKTEAASLPHFAFPPAESICCDNFS